MQMSAQVKAVTDKPFPAAYTDRVRKIGVVNTKNRIFTSIAATLMDGPAALRHYMIDNFVVEGFTFDDVINDDEALETFVRKNTIGVWHASCSCRMGRADDPMSVVDTARPRQGHAGPSRRRCLDLSGSALRQHQPAGADVGGKDRGCDRLTLERFSSEVDTCSRRKAKEESGASVLIRSKPRLDGRVRTSPDLLRPL